MSERSKISQLIKMESDLNRVIKTLEHMQKENYSAITSITLSYLIDIRDDKVPKKMVTDK